MKNIPQPWSARTRTCPTHWANNEPILSFMQPSCTSVFCTKPASVTNSDSSVVTGDRKRPTSSANMMQAQQGCDATKAVKQIFIALFSVCSASSHGQEKQVQTMWLNCKQCAATMANTICGGLSLTTQSFVGQLLVSLSSEYAHIISIHFSYSDNQKQVAQLWQRETVRVSSVILRGWVT